MKIINLQSENFKRIVAVDITPTGNMVEIAGRNGQGKSSILDSISVAIEGMSKAPSQPIRKGQLESSIVISLGNDKPEIVVTRTFRPKADGSEIVSKLTVESADGAKYGSPQSMLDNLLGALTFDPLAFERMDARQQFNTLRAFVPGVDFEAIDNANRGDYDRRQTANRKAKEARAAAAAIKVDQNLPAEPVDASALVAKLEQAGQHNTDIETRKANREKLSHDIQRMREISAGGRSEAAQHRQHAADLIARAEQIEQLAKDNDDKADAAQARLNDAPPLADPIDTAPIRSEIGSADAVNAGIRDRQQRDKLLQDAATFEAEASEYTLSMDKREVEKREAIAAAKLPVAGITFGNNEIMMNDVPFSQASDAERLTASIAIAMAMNPKLRVIRVRDGSLLDDSSMKVLADMAAQHDYQVWIERVSDSGKIGFIIEDGKVKADAATMAELPKKEQEKN